jgi:hypothetical protein
MDRENPYRRITMKRGSYMNEYGRTRMRRPNAKKAGTHRNETRLESTAGVKWK